MGAEKAIFVRLNGTDYYSDQTGSIEKLERQNKGAYCITYCSGKKYTKKASDVIEAFFCESINTDLFVFRHKGRILTGVNAVSSYSVGAVNGSPSWIRVEFGLKGKTVVYPIDEIEICTRIDSKKGYSGYLQRVCLDTEEFIVLENGNRMQYLAQQYERLDTIDGTPAQVFVQGERIEESQQVDTKAAKGTIIFPFGSNLSQISAVEKALGNQLSIIEGPPGTGKTQTILNIIANLVIRNKTVLMTSPNGPATDNVTEKLAKNNLDFLVARLGKKPNIDLFFNNLPSIPEEINNWSCSKKDQQYIQQEINNSTTLLKEIHEMRQCLAQEKTEYERLSLEFKHFKEENPRVVSTQIKKWTNINKLETARDCIRFSAIQGKEFNLLDRIRLCLIFGACSWRELSQPKVCLELSVNYALFEQSLAEKEKTILETEARLTAQNADAVAKRIHNLSLQYLKAYLADCFSVDKYSNLSFSQEDYWKRTDDFRKRFPIITSTTNAARNQIHGKLFDYVIIDESSQASIPTGFLALAAAKDAVVVGDTKQLPCVITGENKARIKNIDMEFNVSPSHSCAEQSLLSVLTSNYTYLPRQLLKEHYRCHPDIIGFCNEAFYDGQLIVMTDANGISSNQALTVKLTNDLNYDRTGEGDYNHVQAKIFREEILKPLEASGVDRSDIGVASPYRAQVIGMVNESCFSGVDIRTVHQYQGREKRNIAFITKKNEITDFLNNANLINVAVSRAIERIVVITTPKIAAGQNNVASLCQYISYRGGKIEHSRVSSSYDLIYPQMEKARIAYLISHGYAPDETYSEIQTEEYINEALTNSNLHGQINFLRNYPLLLFLTDMSILDDAEKQFIRNEAHSDFLFYRVSDRTVLFGIEVNGNQHDEPLQRARDELKKSIFTKFGLGLETIRTNETDVKDKIEKQLKKYYDILELKHTLPVVEEDKDQSWTDAIKGLSNKSF